MQVAGCGRSGAGGRHWTYLWLPMPHRLVETTGLVGHSKRVRRLIGELGLQGKFYCKKKRTTKSNHPFPHYPNLVQDLEVIHPDQLWGDINYIKLRWEFVYLVVLVNVLTRCIRGGTWEEA
jgi:transposase InsO family protein